MSPPQVRCLAILLIVIALHGCTTYRIVDWVEASTTLDRTRGEPEVRTWWRMQHNHLWWIPMHEWDREQDFYADGHAGQRIYVHRPTRTIIVQIADDSRQEFPFRRIAKYLAGSSFPVAENGVCATPPPPPKR